MSLTFRCEIDDSRREEVGLCPVEEDNVRALRRGRVWPSREPYRALGFGEKPVFGNCFVAALTVHREWNFRAFSSVTEA